jgi:hypothetical protein
MNPTLRSDAAEPNASADPDARARAQIRLGDLIEWVASVVPEEAIAATVAALFESGIACFAHRLPRDEQAALRNAS